MIRVAIADEIAEEGVAYLRARPNLEVLMAVGLDAQRLATALSDSQALIVRSATQVTAELLAAAPRLRVIGRAGIGVDNVDVEAATERGIVVLNTPDANATTTAELTVAHLLSLSRHLPEADRSVRAGEWKRNQLLGTEVSGKCIGVIGFGTIGRIVARRCLALGLRVLACDPLVTAEVMQGEGVEPADLRLLLGTADYVSLHCPLNDRTRHLIDAARIGMMKPGARLINCARGGLVDEQALIDALRAQRLAGAALDVYEQEPPRGSPLLTLPNVVLTPHLGASTGEAQVAAGVAIARQVADLLETGESVNAVNLPRIAPEILHHLRPYLHLGRRLGRLLAALAPSPLQGVEVSLCGRAAELDPHPVALEVLVGLLERQLSLPVNRVNAAVLARRQGIGLSESRVADSGEYIALLRVAGRYAEGATTLAGTLLSDRYPRLVRIDEYEIETVLAGTLLITRHKDQPGVVGSLGTLLGEDHVNISRMQVGGAGDDEAMAVIAISAKLGPERLAQIERIPAIRKVYQVDL